MFLFIVCLHTLLPSFRVYKMILLPTNIAVLFKYAVQLCDSLYLQYYLLYHSSFASSDAYLARAAFYFVHLSASVSC